MMKRQTRMLSALALLGLAVGVGHVQAQNLRQQYIEGLRDMGLADLAIDYLQMTLARPGLDPKERPEIEFEIAASLIAVSDAIGDPSKREQKLEEARAEFAKFVKKYPKHEKRADSLVQVATIDLQQGRLRVFQAQLPSNATQTRKLANEGRDFFKKAAQAYKTSFEQFEAAHAKMPVFIPDETPEDKALRRKRSELFEKMIEARFQEALTRFYLADSYESIELPKPEDPKDKQAMEAYKAEKEEWAKQYQSLLESARKGFEEMYTKHRTQLIGLYAHLWMARCLAAQGDHRKAMGIFQQLQEHENAELARLQRQVFHFSMLSYAARKEYDQILNLAEAWLSDNIRYYTESAYRGVQMELARAYIALGNSSGDERSKGSRYFEANRLLDRVASTQNEYTALARREQLKIAAFLKKGPAARSFNQLFSLANAKLDQLKPGMSAAQQAAALAEAKSLFEQAIQAVGPDDPVDIVNDARLSLAYTCLQAGETYEAAVLAEFITRKFYKAAVAPSAAMYAVIAYQWGYENSTQAEQQGATAAHPEIDLARMYSVAEHARARWPNAKETDQISVSIGHIEFSRRNYEKAAAAFDAVQNPRSPDYAQALSLAGLVYWDWYKTLSSQEQGADAEVLKKKRTDAGQRLAKASVQLRELRGGKVDRALFVNDAMLGEVYFESGEEEKALTTLKPLVKLIETPNALPANVEPPFRISVLTTALQCYVNQSNLDEADKLVALISAQQGQEKAGGITRVLVSLADRIKQQIERLAAAGDEQKQKQMQDAFEKFLDRVAGREAGQTLETLLYVGQSFVEIGKFNKAIGMLEKAINHNDAAKPDRQGHVIQARLSLARCYKEMGDTDKALKMVEALLTDPRSASATDVMMERGYILEKAGETQKAIVHWKWVMKRMKASKPRPDEFYEAVDHLVNIYKKMSGADRAKRLPEGYQMLKFLLTTDVSLSPEWKSAFEKHVQEIEPEL